MQTGNKTTKQMARKDESYTLSLKVIMVQDPTIGGYTAYIKQFPYIIAEGEDEKDAMKNLMNAIHDVTEHLNNEELETTKPSNVKVIERSVNFESYEMA